MPNEVSEVDEPPPARRPSSKSGITSILLAVALIVALTAASAWYFTRGSDDASASSGGIVVMPAGSGCDKDAVATQAMTAQGFQPSDFVIGEQSIHWDAPEANERGSAAFSSETPTSAEAVTMQLAAEDDQAKAALSTLKDESGATREQLLTSTNWTPVQFKVASSWDGNTAYRNGEAVPAGTRQSDAGDVVWLFIKPEKCQAAATGTIPATEAVVAHRAGCGNPQTALPRPTSPTPAPPPTPTPPTSPPGEQGKDHRLAPWSPEVVHCPPGQVMDRVSEVCIQWPPATTHPPTTTDGRNDSGDGATNTVPPPVTVAPPVTVPNTTPPTGPPPTPPTIPSF